MLQYLQELNQAIDIRRSHRHYHPLPLKDQDKVKIQTIIDTLEDVPFESDVRLSLHQADESQEIVYFRGPKHFVALTTDESILSQAKLGFLGELIVLYAESQGIRTCWMGHYKKRTVNEIVKNDGLDIEQNKLYCIITLGYIPEKTGIMDRISEKRLSKKTKTVEDLLHPDSLRKFPESIYHALQKANKAPSAMNSQKWKYCISPTDAGYVVEIAKPVGYKHFKWAFYDIDVGTAAAHFWLGMRFMGIDLQTQVYQEEERSLWRFSLENQAD